MKQLRDYQEAATTEIINHLRGSTEPILLNASVGAGKTLMIAHLAKNTVSKGGRVIVLAHQGELIQQNSDEAWEYGLPNSIFAASLGKKGTKINPIFAMRQTLVNALDQPPFASMKVDLLIVDETHTFDFANEQSGAGRIINHFSAINPNLRVVGLTGTPYRGTTPLVGPDQFFTTETTNNISTDYLTEQGWLVETHYGLHDHSEEIDFSGLDIRHNEETGGNYSEEDFDRILQGEYQKTMEICAQVHRNAQKMDNGCLIFCGSKLHTEQVKLGLINAGANPETIAIVTDATSDTDRDDARIGAIEGRIKYFINVGVASTGWNVPRWEYLVYMRPVGSLTFFLQSKGRVLRPFLTPDESAEFNAAGTTAERRKEILAASRKPYAVVDDYAGVMEKLAPYLEADMSLQEAKRERSIKEGETKICPLCSFENGAYAQRCINHYEQGNGKDERCLHFWQFNECRDPHCTDELGRRTQNAVTAKNCRICQKVIIDPNKALLNRAYRDDEYRPVKRMTIELAKNQKGVVVRFELVHPDPDIDGNPWLYFHLDGSENSKRIWYNNFVKVYVTGSSWQQRARNMSAPTVVKSAAMFNQPTHITVRKNDKGKFVIGRRLFRSGRESVEQEPEVEFA